MTSWAGPRSWTRTIRYTEPTQVHRTGVANCMPVNTETQNSLRPGTFDALEPSNPVGLTVPQGSTGWRANDFSGNTVAGCGVGSRYRRAPSARGLNCPVQLWKSARVAFDDGSRDRAYPPPEAAPPPVTLPPETTPLAVQITTPATGFTTSRSNIEVTGTFAGPPNTGIRINGRTPFIDGNQFVLPALSLASWVIVDRSTRRIDVRSVTDSHGQRNRRPWSGRRPRRV